MLLRCLIKSVWLPFDIACTFTSFDKYQKASLAKLLLEFCIVILNRRGKRGVAFSKNCISYNGKKYPLYNISFKYLTFQLSFLQAHLVVPQLVISIPDDHNIICYINKRQLNALKNEMGYEIKVVY